MTEARWNGATIAASDRCVVVEGNSYFPPDAVGAAHLRPSATTHRPRADSPADRDDGGLAAAVRL